jgi:hypothetical protein
MVGGTKVTHLRLAMHVYKGVKSNLVVLDKANKFSSTWKALTGFALH